MSDCCGGKENLQKYLVLQRVGYLAIQEAINHFYDLGYKLRSVHKEKDEGLMTWYAVVELGSGPDVRDGVDFVNVEKETNNPDGSILIRRMTDAGWVPVSEYSKHITLMKVKT